MLMIIMEKYRRDNNDNLGQPLKPKKSEWLNYHHTSQLLYP